MLKDGGIVGDMQIGPWDPKIAKWTKHDNGSDTYTYDFTANSTQANWKVLVHKGDSWKSGLFYSQDENGALVNDNGSTVDMVYVKCEGSEKHNFYANNLIEGKHYRITVKVESNKLTIKINVITDAVAPAVDLREGGILTSMNWNKTNDWKTKPADLNASTSQVYTYEFAATTTEIQWKVLTKKDVVTYPGFAGKPGDDWTVQNNGTEQKLNYGASANPLGVLKTSGLETGSKYTITVKVDGNRVTAMVKKN